MSLSLSDSSTDASDDVGEEEVDCDDGAEGDGDDCEGDGDVGAGSEGVTEM